MKRNNSSFLYLTIGVAIFAAWLCSRYWYRILLIHGESMLPTYHDMQAVLMEVHVKDYSYGDVIAFECQALDAVLVKRVAGCPGDVVEIRSGRLYVNGASLMQPAYIDIDYAGIAAQQVTLGGGEYFVLGDNLAMSKDSRYEEIGRVREGQILGRVVQGVVP